MRGSTHLGSQSSGEHGVLVLRSCAWRSTEGSAIQTAAAIQIPGKTNIFFKGSNQPRASPVCVMANATFLGYGFLPWKSLPHLRHLRREESPVSGTSRRATWGHIVKLRKLTSMPNGSFVRGSDFHQSESHSAAVLQAHDKAS